MNEWHLKYKKNKKKRKIDTLWWMAKLFTQRVRHIPVRGKHQPIFSIKCGKSTRQPRKALFHVLHSTGLLSSSEESIVFPQYLFTKPNNKFSSSCFTILDLYWYFRKNFHTGLWGPWIESLDNRHWVFSTFLLPWRLLEEHQKTLQLRTWF